MYVTHCLAPTIQHLPVCSVVSGVLAGFVISAQPIAASLARLRQMAFRIHSRMQLVGLNETQLAERCSLAGIHLFEDAEVPNLTRDRVSKILMNRRDEPAASAARVITQAELAVLANVLSVSVEWLIGQEENRDPVVWNVLANPDRVVEFAHVIQEYEEMGKESTVWSQYPMHSLVSEAFIHSFNLVNYGSKPGIANPRSLVEFYNRLARLRRKRILRPGRPFQYTTLLYRSHFEEAVCGQGVFSAIPKTILRRNIDLMIDTISNPSLRIKLVIINDDYVAALEAVRNYKILSVVDTLFSSWNYHSGDVGWSEHPTYVQPHRQLLDTMSAHSECRDLSETVEYLKSLQSRLAGGPK